MNTRAATELLYNYEERAATRPWRSRRGVVAAPAKSARRVMACVTTARAPSPGVQFVIVRRLVWNRRMGVRLHNNEVGELRAGSVLEHRRLTRAPPAGGRSSCAPPSAGAARCRRRAARAGGRTAGHGGMGIIIGTCVPDAEPDAAAYGSRPPRRLLYVRRRGVQCCVASCEQRHRPISVWLEPEHMGLGIAQAEQY
ncbi:hypothetical protein EVAR_56188_1 [Eumeta japonica]|uniref:Uncharacterized protein n=1 Tax=Eumeta variegata TaxID=151549 RepID=A0A4C1ZUZ6_EUMVA|nr:hypothetical protein EVAR_56188_1 [Eumeta japonica]